ncbi:MAG: methylenetetrahydrofolate reductase [Coriobacteriia bacterium]|nr:methylenetetrahydrofolate reductase [Coriobacteriia bacterium]
MTAEVNPPKPRENGERAGAMRRAIKKWADCGVDAVNITDSPSGVLRMESIEAAEKVKDLLESTKLEGTLKDIGIEFIVQKVCRGVERANVKPEILDKLDSIEEFRHVLALTGDAPRPTIINKHGDHTGLNSTRLLEAATDEFGCFHLGAAAFLETEPWEAQFARICEKVEKGARFFQTQGVMDVNDKVIERIKQIKALDVKVIVGVFILGSSDSIGLIKGLEGIDIRDENPILERLRKSKGGYKTGTEFRREAIKIATEQALALVKPADGIHLMTFGPIDDGVKVYKNAGLRDEQTIHKTNSKLSSTTQERIEMIAI